MTIEDILELMDDAIDKAPSVPLATKKGIIDKEQMREYIDNIRLNLPTEIKKAREMVGDRAQIISEANQKAESIIKRAEERAKIIVSNEEIVKLARERANEITTNANAMEKEIRAAMTAKMDELLNTTEQMLNQNLADIRKTRAAIREAGKKK